jgi:hypothetical protein
MQFTKKMIVPCVVALAFVCGYVARGGGGKPDTDDMAYTIDSLLTIKFPAIMMTTQDISVMKANIQYHNYIERRHRPRYRHTLNDFEKYYKGE